MYELRYYNNEAGALISVHPTADSAHWQLQARLPEHVDVYWNPGPIDGLWIASIAGMCSFCIILTHPPPAETQI